MTVPDMTVLSADGQPSASTIRRLYELSNHLLGVCDAGRLIVVNPAWERALGWSTRELLSLDDWTRLVHPDDLDRVNGCTAESGLRRSTEIRIRTADGRYRTFSWTAISDGRLWYSLGIDITAMRADTELVRRLAAIVAHSDDAIVSTDRHAAITSWNAGAERLYGYCAAEIIGRPAHLLVPPDLRGEEAEVLAKVLAGQHIDHYETRRVCRDGMPTDVSLTVSPILDGDGHPVGASVVARDISERIAAQNALRDSEQRLRRTAQQAVYDSRHDALTGLPNRRLLAERLYLALRAAETGGYRIGLVLLDLDRFRQINDGLGHLYGDKLLVQVGNRLLRALDRPGTVARLGDDEFVVLLPKVSGVDEVVDVAERLRQSTEEPLPVDDVEFAVEASAGIAVSGDHGDDAMTLLRHAEVAMYVAKRRVRGLAVYEPRDDHHDPRKLALLGELRRAIDRGELELYYQPKVRLDTGELCGVEALVRWQHPARGTVPPVEFVAIAEQTGLIGPFTRHVLDLALAQSARWAAAGRAVPVAVNLAARNLSDPDLGADVLAALDRHGVPPRRLTLELTETAITTEPEHAARLLTALHAAGIGLSVDDFGTGYTSLAQLTRLPVTELKIDRSFVSALVADRNNRIMVRGIVELARSLGLCTVGEGVEDAETMAALAACGCTVAQGYHIARPLPVAEFDRWYAVTVG